MRAAAVQLAPVPFALEANLAAAEAAVRAAAAQGAQLVVLPACFNTGYVYSPRLTAAAEPPAGLSLQRLTALSAELNIYLAAAAVRRQGREVVMVAVLVTPDGCLTTAAQRRLGPWEAAYFAPGAGPLVADTALGRLGLLVGWDFTDPAAWAALAGRVDAVVLPAAPVRLHRAVLNFPAARKVHLAELMPALLPRRAALDDLASGYLGQAAAALGAPVIHAGLAGRFVAQLPCPRRSFLAAALTRPRYWAWVTAAPQVSLRATFYAASAVYATDGRAITAPLLDAGLALADLTAPPAPAQPPRAVPPAPIPAQARFAAALLRPALRHAYATHRAP
ncbi:MAG: carbon-nitrogen hydrolase family protein [Anaerolineales bacterium]|nr:carbon-nitrogen hydrolase family protein [Anaerolineales bacterium]